MTDDEWIRWRDTNAAISWPKVRTDDPCRDCTAAFAATMRARDLCDGTPGARLGAASHGPMCSCRAHRAVPA